MSELSDLEIAHIVEFGEAEAMADMYAAAPPELGFRVERVGEAFVFIAPTLPIVFFNRVIGLESNQPAVESMVTDITHLYAVANVPTYAVQISSVVNSSNLPDWLQAHHLIHRNNWSKVYRKPETSITVATDLRVDRIDSDHAADFAYITVNAFGMPAFLKPWLVNLVSREGWQHYIAFDGELAVSAGALFIKNGIGWSGIDGTLASHRKRGSQGAIMARRIRDAAAVGCDWIITETDEDTPEHPNPSYHNMLRTGFTLAYQRRNYIFEVEGYK